jgi:RimJ/RimL family protein N-acetyltransferase
MTEMLAGIIGWVKKRDDIEILTAETEMENIPSKKALERAGFTLTEIKENSLIYTIRLNN